MMANYGEKRTTTSCGYRATPKGDRPSLTIYDLLAERRETARTTRDQGDQFERLMHAFFRTDPLYREKFSDVWVWQDWPGRNGRPDCGIDLVAQQADSDDLWALQCKFWDHRVTKEDLDSFFTESGKRPFTQRLIVATSTLSKHAEEAMEGQWVDTHTLTLDDLDHSAIDWGQFSWTHPDSLRIRQPKIPRPHQERAIADVLEGFQTADRGQLIMACGTGKTLTGLHVAEALVPPEGGTVLVLTPSIALVSQTLREWTAEARRSLRSYAVCSDTKVGKDTEDLRPSDLSFPATTDPQKLAEEITRSRTSGATTVIFSTYQSIEVISQAQQHQGLPAFDLVICDEAHRTVGTAQKTAKGQTQSYFTMVHEEAFVRARKRLYMTATPRIYAEDSKRRAEDNSVVLYSMDDEAVFGPEFHRLPFSEAVEADILSDYKVIILTVDEAEALALFGEDIHDEKKLDAKLTDEAKIVGCLRAFAKRFPKEEDDDIDTTPMQRVVAFTNSIADSKRVTHLLSQVTESLPAGQDDLLLAESQHVDGTMNVANRNAALTWLKGASSDASCRVLTNARCLTEGIDVPSLDGVVFLQPRDSQVDVVQAVGRVMRKAPGKQFGYVVLPVVIPADMKPEDILEDRKEYRVVWQVLNALRSHDDHFNDMINHLEFNKKSRKVRIIGKARRPQDGGQIHFQWTSQELQRVFYAKLVKKVGDREYWDEWARKVAGIVDRYRLHIHDILERPHTKAQESQTAFDLFLAGLHENVNDSVTRGEAIDMLAQHLVTKPVFDALFADYAFTERNPVSQSMERVLAVLETHALWKEKESVARIEGKLLDQLHREIERQAGGIETAEGKQQFLIKIYDKFFRIALKKTADRLGIVYTPIEVVDFILHSVEAILQKEFGQRLTDENVHILDPFTGTGTFLVRLLQSGLIRPEDIVRKYRQELHANEIVLLAYYLAAINIEQTFHAVSGQGYEPFPGIVLTDTFQQGESRKDFMGQENFPENNERLASQNNTEVRVIVSNPPWSAGQESQNDNNQNLRYPHLDERIAESYAASSTATSKRTLYDSYIRAVRWASDRIGNYGVIAFVTNAMFVDSSSADGLRKCLTKEFSSIYCMNLRGDQLHSVGEQSRREGGKIFGSGSRQPVAITVLVKNPSSQKINLVRYLDIGDYLSREEKLERIRNYGNIECVAWTVIEPNDAGDWINQRTENFQRLIPLGDKKGQDSNTIFDVYSLGVATSRDVWTYNFSNRELRNNMQAMVDFYNNQVDEFNHTFDRRGDTDTVNAFIDNNPRRISWSRGLKNDIAKGRKHNFHEGHIVKSAYRPFCTQWLYFDRALNDMVYQVPKLFPLSTVDNIVISVTGVGATKPFSALVTRKVPDLQLMDKGQCFPMYIYNQAQWTAEIYEQPSLFTGENEGQTSPWIKRHAITDWALQECRVRYGPAVTKEDVFYYVYGLLHSPDYRAQFGADLKKMLPRIPFVESKDDFWAFSKSGRELAHWHLDYESVEPWPVEEIIEGLPRETDHLYRVEKMRFCKNSDGSPDKTTIVYNAFVTLKGIPLEAYDYVVNGKSALEWVMERYQVKTDKDSGILNDPNEWSDDPRYIVDLVKRVLRVSLETLRIVEGLPVVMVSSDSKAEKKA